MNVRVYYEDTDCGGVVYYANYLKYFERARTGYLEDHGIDVKALLMAGTQFMVIHAEVAYRSPARYGDTLTIDTWISNRSKARLTMSHIVRDSGDARLIVEGSATLAAVDADGRLKRLPAEILALPDRPLAKPVATGRPSRSAERRHG